LRKGSPYVLEAARRLHGQATFRMVGPIRVLPEAVRQLEEHVELVGEVPRSLVAKHLAWADLFLLPSLCEGSAQAIYEAMAAGLPVVCTPNCGSIVRHGLDGLIVPASNPEAIVEAIQLLADPQVRAELGANARERVRQFGPGRYARQLFAALRTACPELSTARTGSQLQVALSD
jgi:glycosyltransferase involved in cell wall biosynthesis